ncbi:MAG: hypothetical protein IJH12_07075 [Clostridia bacterium]|nr:hypothetical protein [Clostridia bacterium]
MNLKKDSALNYENIKLPIINNINIFEAIKKYRSLQIILVIIVLSIIMNIVIVPLYISKVSTYNELTQSYDLAKNEYKNLENEYSELSDNQQTLSTNYDSLQKKYDGLENNYKEVTQEKYQSELTSKISELEKNKSNLETQVDKLSKDVITLKGAEKSYPAGYLTAGTDFEVGRYKIYGGSSNFIVHSSSGSLRVNIILGHGSYDVSEYLYTFKLGDEIDARSSFKMVPIE